MEKCLHCQFYDRRNTRPTDGRSAMWGQCRRHPALLNPVSAKNYLVEGVWPLVRDDDWCGEWSAPTHASMSRSQFEPRTDKFPTSATAGTSAAADRSFLGAFAAATAAGND